MRIIRQLLQENRSRLFELVGHFCDCCHGDGCHDALVDSLVQRMMSIVGDENFPERRLDSGENLEGKRCDGKDSERQ